jgi:3-deoxy-D-manno-octulosonic acid (KDO) 8-phosphate synthase
LIIHVSNHQRGVDGLPTLHEASHDRERRTSHHGIRSTGLTIELPVRYTHAEFADVLRQIAKHEERRSAFAP